MTPRKWAHNQKGYEALELAKQDAKESAERTEQLWKRVKEMIEELRGE